MRGAGCYAYKFQRGVFEETDSVAVSLLAGLEALCLTTAGGPPRRRARRESPEVGLVVGLINPLAALVLSGSPTLPEYGLFFSLENSLEFHRKDTEYSRCVNLSNSGQSIQRPLLPLSQLLRPEVCCCCLSRKIFFLFILR